MFHRFRHAAFITTTAILAGSASAQVQANAQITYQRAIESHLNTGNETLDLLGIGTDPDDGTTFLVCKTNTQADCPSPDNIHIYRHDTSSNTWVFEDAIDHPGFVSPNFVEVRGDTIAIGQSFSPGNIGNDGTDIYRRNANGWAHEAFIRPADNNVGDYFGASVSIDQDILAVGAPQEGDDPRASQIGPGSVYVFQRINNTWTQIDKVTSDDGSDGDDFGRNIKIRATTDGWRLIVGAPDHSTDPSDFNLAGAVYAFQHINGTTTQLNSVARSTNQLAVGDFGSDGIGFDSEIAAVVDQDSIWSYRFDPVSGLQPIGPLFSNDTLSAPVVENRTILVSDPSGSLANATEPNLTRIHEDLQGNWVTTHFPRPPQFVDDDLFGSHIAFNGTLIAAGVPGLDLDVPNAGGVWTQTTGPNTYPTTLLLEGVGSANAHLAESIAADGEWIALGSPGATSDCIGIPTGSVRMLRASGPDWITTQVIIPPPSTPGGEFGHALSLHNDTLAISIPGYQASPTEDPVGAVLLYKRTGSTWIHTHNIYGQFPGAGFGAAIALENNDLIIAQPNHNGSGSISHYHRNSQGQWITGITTNAPGLTPGARFGHALSLHNGTLLVGAPHNQNESGSVYAFTLTNNTLTFNQTLTVPGAQTNAQAGWAIAQSDTHAFIGLPYQGTLPGFQFPGQLAIIPKSGNTFGPGTSEFDPFGLGTGFGSSIAANNALLAVSSHDPGHEAIRLFADSGSGFQFLQSVLSPTNAQDSSFGSSVALVAQSIVIGAPNESTPIVTQGGRAHLFDIELRYTVPECDQGMLDDRVQWVQDDAPNSGEWFAKSIAVDQGFAIAGVPYDHYSYTYNGNTVNANNTGKAVIFQRTAPRTWTPVATFRGNNIESSPPPGIQTDWHGWAVDIKHNTAAAGGTQAYDESTNLRSGSVQIYERTLTGWSRTIELFPSNNSIQGSDQILEFGASVDFDSTSNLLAIGAANSRIGGVTGTGAGFVYERVGDQWLESNQLSPPTALFADHDGLSIAVEESWLALGSPDNDTYTGGAVHMFQRTAPGLWVFHSSLHIPNISTSARFGASVELDRSDIGLTLIVGAPNTADGFVNSVGAAYAFVLDPIASQWNLFQELRPELPRTSTSYGTSVVIDHNSIAVGGPYIQNPNAIGTQWTGGVEVYNLDANTGQFTRRILIRSDPPEWGTANGWGSSVGLSGGNVLLGSNLADGEPFDPANVNRSWGAFIAYDIICVPDCRVDLNNDGTLDFFDISLFLANVSAQDPSADFNGDSMIDFFDISAFLTEFALGC